MAPEGPNCSIIKDIWDEFAAGGKVIAVFYGANSTRQHNEATVTHISFETQLRCA